MERISLSDDYLVAAAQGFAAAMHREHRYNDEPYHEHLRQVANILLQHGYSRPSTLAAAWLHDVVEDCGDSERLRDLILAVFGPGVAEIVFALTDPPGNNRAARKAKAYVQIRERGGAAVAVKLADRIANVSTAKLHRPDLYSMYKKEQQGFEAALRRFKENDSLWVALNVLFEEQP